MADTLTELQRTLLRTAAGRPDGSIFPMPDALPNRADRIHRSVQGLITKGLAEQGAVTNEEQSWRMEDDLFVGVIITPAGRASLIGEADADKTGALAAVDAATYAKLVPQPADRIEVPYPAPALVKRDTKAALLISMLVRPDGTSIEEVVEATGWLPHTARAAITILKTKKGHNVERTGERGASRYCIAEAG